MSEFPKFEIGMRNGQPTEHVLEWLSEDCCIEVILNVNLNPSLRCGTDNDMRPATQEEYEKEIQRWRDNWREIAEETL